MLKLSKKFLKIFFFFFLSSNNYKNQQPNGSVTPPNNTNSQQVHTWSPGGQINGISSAYFVSGTENSVPYNGKYYMTPNMPRQNNACGNQYQQYQYPQVPYFPFSQPAAVQQ